MNSFSPVFSPVYQIHAEYVVIVSVIMSGCFWIAM